MKVKGRARIHGTPEFQLRAHAGPMGFEVEGTAGFKLSTGVLSARVHEIPITMKIPFLRRDHGVQTVATIGGFGVCVEPFDVEVKAFGVRFCGLLCKDGLDAELNGKVECRHEVDLEGTVFGRLAKVAIALDDDDAMEETLGD